MIATRMYRLEEEIISRLESLGMEVIKRGRVTLNDSGVYHKEDWVIECNHAEKHPFDVFMEVCGVPAAAKKQNYKTNIEGDFNYTSACFDEIEPYFSYLNAGRDNS